MKDIKFWRYSLPPINGEGWGIFLLDSTGMFSCVSDYGNYAFKWTHHGMNDFREFFKSRSFDYYVNKLYRNNGGELEVQTEETVKSIKQSILRSRYEDHMDGDTARREWDLLESIDWNEGEFARHEWYQATDLCDAHEFFVYDYPAEVKALRDKLFPRFCEVVQKELKSEELTA